VSEATFDEHNWCDTPGWATYQDRPMRRFRLRCWLGRHAVPADTPAKPNGYSPCCYSRCSRCRAHLKWYVEGQHRYGGVDRYFANLDPQSAATAIILDGLERVADEVKAL